MFILLLLIAFVVGALAYVLIPSRKPSSQLSNTLPVVGAPYPIYVTPQGPIAAAIAEKVELVESHAREQLRNKAREEAVAEYSSLISPSNAKGSK